MGNRGARRNAAFVPGADPYLSQYGATYGYGPQPGLSGYGTGYTPGVPVNSLITPPTLIEQPWQETQWTEVYVPTVGGRTRRPVIYVAVPYPGGNSFGGFGGSPFGGGFGGGLPLGGGFGGFGGGSPFGGGFGGLGGNQVLPMVTAQYLGGIPGVPGFGAGLGGLGTGGLPLF